MSETSANGTPEIVNTNAMRQNGDVRPEIDFITYAQFNSKNTPKTKLASLCVSLRACLDILQEESTKIKNILSANNQTYETAEARLNAINDVRKDRYQKILLVVKPVWESRNQKFNTKLPDFVRTLDLFKNVTDSEVEVDVPSDSALDALTNDMMRTQVTNLNDMVNDYGDRLREKDALLIDAQNEVEVLAKKLKMAEQKIRDQMFQMVHPMIGLQGDFLPRANRDQSNSTLQQHHVEVNNDVSINKVSDISSYKGSYKLDSKTPSFRSRLEDDIDKWLIKIEASLTFARVEKPLWITACFNYLEGIAFELSVAAVNAGHSWDRFKEDLIKTFRPVNKDFDLRAKLLKLKESENFDKYLHDFRTLVNQIPDSKLSKLDKFTAFVSGLRHKTRVEIFQRKITTLDEAIEFACQLNSAGSIDKSSNTQVNLVRVQRGKVAGRPKQINKDKTCHRCGKLGHIKKDCRVKLPSDFKPTDKAMTSKPSSFDSKRPYNPAMNFVCRKCNKKGHYTSNCKSAIKTAHTNLVEINMLSLESVNNTVSSPALNNEIHNEEIPVVAHPNLKVMINNNSSIVVNQLEDSWCKFDELFFQFNISTSVTANDTFCKSCKDININLNRKIWFPRRCVDHCESYVSSGIKWDIENSSKPFPFTNDELKFLFDMSNDSTYDVELRQKWKNAWATANLNKANHYLRQWRMERGVPELNEEGPYPFNQETSVSSKLSGKCNNDLDKSESDRDSSDDEDMWGCININISDIDRLWFVNGIVDMGGKNVNYDCVLDTGATNSVISSSVVKTNNLVVIDTDLQVRQADGKLVKLLGITNPLKITVSGKTSEISFLIIQNAKHDFLLGMDWIEANRCILNPSKRLLWFEEEKNEHYILASERMLENELSKNLDDYNDFSEWDSEDIDGELSWEWPEKCLIKPQAKLTKRESKQFDNLANKLEKFIAKDINELGKSSLFKHVIHTVDEIPVYIPPYRKSHYEREEVKKQIQEMLDAGIIRPSKSPYSSPIILVPKPNGTKRMCIDFRCLNKKTVQQNFPIPVILDILDRLNGSKYFSTLDLKSGYWQMEMDPESIKKTAFSTQDGHYEFVRLPFGLKNAPADFSRMMYMTLGDLPFVEIYLDDITIHSKSFQDHINHIQIVMEKLAEVNLKINHEKCTWCSDTVKILGHIVSYNEIRMDPKKILALKEWKHPKNVKQVQQFLGLANYYRRFVKDFSRIAAPLYNLLKKDTLFNFSEDCVDAFEKLKMALISEPVLRPPDFNKEFFLFTDSSGYCLGIVLGQKDDEGKDYVVAYASRMLKGAELHYSITEKEALGVVFGIKHFRVYLYGKKFTIITDHAALSWMMNLRDFKGLNPRVIRWTILVQSYMFDVIHRAGRIHSNVDVLSRPILNLALVAVEDDIDSYEKGLDIYEYEPLLYYIKHGKHIPGISNKSLRRVVHLSQFYRFNGTNVTFRKKEEDKPLIVPQIEDRSKLIMESHLVGHFAAKSTYDRLAEKYYWKKMMDQIVTCIKNCETCARQKKEAELNHPAIALKVTGLFDRIGIDLVFGLPETQVGFIGIMVITESLSKYPWAKPIKSKSAVEIAEVLKEYICVFGAPKTIVSDRGTEFNNEVVDSMLKNIGIEHRVTSAYNPRANGLTERTNQTIINALRKHVETDHLSWHKWLDWVLFAYRTRVHSSTGFSPFQLLFGRMANSFEDWRTNPDTSKVLELEIRSLEIKNLFEKVVPEAKKKIEKSQEQQKKSQNKRTKIIDELLKVGTKVMVVNDDKLIKKLEDRYRGPYTIMDVTKNNNYVLQDLLKRRIENSFPLKKLKVLDKDVDENNFFEIEKIISHKIVNNKPLYLVKWKNLNESENSYVKPEDFASMKFVNDYLKTVDSKRNTRSNTTLKMSTVLQIIIFGLFFLLNCGYAKDLVIEDKYDFDFCPVTLDLMPINLDKMCHISKEKSSKPILDWMFKYFDITREIMKYLNTSATLLNFQKQNEISLSSSQENPIKFNKESVYKIERKRIFNFQAYILSKSLKMVSGKAFQCKKVIYTRTWSKNFWGTEYRNDEVKTENLDSESCWYMVNTKKCVYGSLVNNMTCDENMNCNFEEIIKDEYSWMQDITKSFAHCYVSPKFIAESDLNSHIFNGKCKVSDWFCKMHDSIIVWHRDVIHSCPFKIISLGNMFSKEMYFLEKEQKLGFQFKSIETHCGVDMIKTTEGLYLAPPINEIKKLEKFDDFKDTKGAYDMLLADADYKMLETMEDDKYLLYKECTTFVSMLKLFAFNDNQFLRTQDYQGKDIILYTSGGMIYLPHCVKITNVTVFKLEQCYEDLPVKFIYKNREIFGFVTTNRILRISSIPKPCKSSHIYIPLPYLNKTIVAYNQDLGIVDSLYVKFQDFEFFNHSLSKNLSHAENIVQGIDLLGQINNLTKVIENGNTWLLEPNVDSISDMGNENLRSVSFIIGNMFWTIIKYVLYIIGIAFLITLIGILIRVAFWARKIYITKKLNRRNENQERPVIYQRVPSRNIYGSVYSEAVEDEVNLNIPSAVNNEPNVSGLNNIEESSNNNASSSHLGELLDQTINNFPLTIVKLKSNLTDSRSLRSSIRNSVDTLNLIVSPTKSNIVQ